MTATLDPPHRPGVRPRPTTPPPRGRDASWIALAALLVGTAVLYLWNLAASGWANTFLRRRRPGRTQSWEAFLFGSLDAGNVDHRRQAARLAVGDGAVGADLRLLLVEHAGAAGADGRRPVALLYAAVRRVAGPGRGAARRARCWR